jgi:multiple sugar transport system permease protein
MKISKKKLTVAAITRIAILLLFIIFLLFPFYWMLVTSLKTDRELYNLSYNPMTIRLGITFSHYAYLFKHTLFLRWFANTVVITVSVTAITLIFSLLAAFSITRLRFRGRTAFALGIFAAYLVPPTLLFIPLYSVLKLSGLIDSIWALVLTYPTFTIPFCTWLLMGYLKTIPKELDESATIDGASKLQTLTKIIVPLALPGLTTVALFSFSLSWSQFLYGVAFVSSSPEKPLAVGVVSELVRGDVFYWGSLMGGALLASVPVVVLYAFFARYFISGLTAGAVKS